jgi:hypothetical protein
MPAKYLYDIHLTVHTTTKTLNYHLKRVPFDNPIVERQQVFIEGPDSEEPYKLGEVCHIQPITGKNVRTQFTVRGKIIQDDEVPNIESLIKEYNTTK